MRTFSNRNWGFPYVHLGYPLSDPFIDHKLNHEWPKPKKKKLRYTTARHTRRRNPGRVRLLGSSFVSGAIVALLGVALGSFVRGLSDE